MPGVFITFEGIEGSGKSTQISRLLQYLTEQRRPVTLTREPGGTPIGDQVRRILLDPLNRLLDPTTELLLYAASRAQHLREVIRPALASGRIVLCDRFSDATIAYQGYGRGLSVPVIRELDRIVTAGLRPRLTVLLDLPAETGLGRARGRNTSQGLHGEARFENEDIAFHSNVRNGYLQLAKEEPGRIRTVNAARSPEEVQEDIRTIVDEVLDKAM
ncbi:MAG: dTMP kinase [Nitrospirae bacterium]|nr:dTMP kinase [Nitrospirota bacterium]NTW65352.1 dTMP kinase [Nitrospirota bacterium]